MGLVGSEDSPALSVTWAHRAEQSASAWARAHARGEVPSVWPYGLDALRDHAVVEVDELPDPGRIARLRARAGVGPRPRAGLAIAWDENTAYRLQIRRPRTRFAAGVIWLTDLAAAGAAPARLVAMLRAATALWVLSEAQVVPLQRLLGAGGPRVFVVPFGIDQEFFSAQPPAARPQIVSAGNDRDRDPVTLYAALALVLAARPGVDVVVQSPSALVPPEGVRLVRRLSHTELRDLYTSASVVVTATRPFLYASGMTVALEALATVSDTPGMRDYVSTRTGLLVPPEEPEALAEALVGMLDDPDRAAALGRQGRIEVERRFTTTAMVDALVRGLRADG